MPVTTHDQISARYATGSTHHTTQYCQRIAAEKERERERRTEKVGEERDEPADEVPHADRERRRVQPARGHLLEALTKLEEERGEADGAAPPEARLRVRAGARAARGVAARGGRRALAVRVDLDVHEAVRDRAARLLVDADGAEHRVHLALHLALARAQHARARLLAQVPVVVALRLRREEAADAHRDRARDELGDPAEDDQLGLAERGEPRGEREGDREPVGEADHAVTEMTLVTALKGA